MMRDADRIRALRERIAYLDRLIDERGPNRWREREADALDWALDLLADDPDLADAFTEATRPAQ